MRPSHLIPLALAAALALPGVARAQLTEDFRYRGTITDTHGQPIPEVNVLLREKSGRTITFKTKKDGSFDRRMIPKGTYTATFSKDGYVPLEQPYDWTKAGAETITVEGKIVLQSEGEKKEVELQKASAELGKKQAKLYEDAYTAFTANDCGTAEKNIAELLAMGTGSYEYAVHYLHARCLQLRGANAEAEAAYRKVIELKPDFFGAHFDLAGMLETGGDHDGAIKAYTAAAALKPDDAESEYNIGAIHLRAGRFDQALPHLTRTLELNPSHAPANKALALVYISGEKKDMPQALTLFKKYLELEPNAGDATQIQQMVAELEKSSKATKPAKTR